MAWERLRKHGASTESDSRELWKLTLKMAGKWTRFVVMKKRGFFFFFLGQHRTTRKGTKTRT